jgi:hypothetical protein
MDSAIPWKRFAAAVALAILAGCGGGGGDTSSGTSASGGNQPVTNASPGGIWNGTDGQGLQVTGIITETGEAYFLDSDGTQYFGTVTTSGNDLAGSFTGYTELGKTFMDGSTSGTGTLTGTVDARSTLSFTTTFNSQGGGESVDNVLLQYFQTYAQASSLSTIAGSYTETANGDVLTVNSDGSALIQESETGCVVNGTVSIVNASYNAYGVQFSYSGCQGEFAVLNGSTFNGLATLDSAVSPEQLIVGTQAKVGATGVSIIITFNRT